MATIPKNLGRLERVDLRDVWTTEAGDFTPWLAEEQNIALLGDTIGIELEVESQEKSVGPFRADILCKDTSNDTWVLIENQLERTDHVHLGQLITYAAGLNAVTIVWVAHRFADEHRAALDWLNDVTGEGIEFFGLEVELWKIGNSLAAPKFNIVSSPNDWSKTASKAAKAAEAGNLTPTQQLQLEFWTAFREYVETKKASFKPTKAYPQTWMTLTLGKSGVVMTAIASAWDSESQSYDKNEIRAEIEINNRYYAKHFYQQLSEAKDEIESEFGEPLTWYNPEDKRTCRIYQRLTVDLHDRDRWPEYHEWLRTKLERLRKVFRPRVMQLSTSAPSGDDADV
ncbi:hypothetical protein Mal4_35380 [Maioricimonas rarisocia]|uniref:DUF4268 domain-containing protein n=1 Tax=Maioricimonas rarisocia TaxID=2528026 RepID=A0A517Z9T6_9PLAN|nr:DUF4268 domain-containing protein [Maioricimonas rarisocia]QDU39201.1 hypothetical protein Mal4_35380 [Maioricimonas rarisocia]